DRGASLPPRPDRVRGPLSLRAESSGVGQCAHRRRPGEKIGRRIRCCHSLGGPLNYYERGAGPARPPGGTVRGPPPLELLNRLAAKEPTIARLKRQRDGTL